MEETTEKEWRIEESIEKEGCGREMEREKSVVKKRKKRRIRRMEGKAD